MAKPTVTIRIVNRFVLYDYLVLKIFNAPDDGSYIYLDINLFYLKVYFGALKICFGCPDLGFSFPPVKNGNIQCQPNTWRIGGIVE